MFAPQLVALFGGDLGGTALWEEVWHWRQAGHSLCIFLVVKNVSSQFSALVVMPTCLAVWCPDTLPLSNDVMDPYTSVTVSSDKPFLL